jgi:hypothetical protein
MLIRIIISVATIFAASVTACAESELQALPPYPLPAAAEQPIKELADRSDVLILGEMHGTQEVPEVVATLLPMLTELGYHVLALEVPSDQQAALTDWATGKTQTVPSFYAKPWTDGRGNQQMLSLIRMALSKPYSWKLICFDEGLGDEQREIEELKRKIGEEALNKAVSTQIKIGTEPDWIITIWQRRDSTMAANFEKQRQQFATHGKVVAICGDLHARTANPQTDDNFGKRYWPSFAAVLQSSQPGKPVTSIDVDPKSGHFFNGGKVNDLGGKPHGEAEAHLLENGQWNLKLNLPHATAATFLATPTDPDTGAASAAAPNK